MNVLLLFFKSHFVQFVGWILLHSIWQGALIALSFRFTEHFSNKASDQFRYAAACGALLLMCVAPVCTVLLSGVPSGGITVPSVTVSQSQTQPIGAPGETPLASPAAPSRSVSDLLNRVAPFTTLAWLVGVSIFSVRMSRGWLQLRSLRLAPAEPVPPHWLERLADLRCRLEITRPVILMKSALVQVPSVMGWLRPIILFPAAAISELSPDQLDAILAHELAHIRRNDFLVNVFQCLAETFFFYHPMVWWISGRIREERENCCDDLVIVVCEDKLAYAQALARLEQSRVTLPNLAFGANGGSLLNRIRRLLGVAPAGARLSPAHACGAVLVSLGLVAIATGVCLLFQPSTGYAMARISYEMENADGSPVPPDGFRPEPSQIFLQTQAEMIHSPVLLSKVAKDLDLEELWAKRLGHVKPVPPSYLIAELHRMVEARHIPNTTLIDICVSSVDANEAAKIANAAAADYREQQIERYSEMAATGIAALESVWVKQEQKIQVQRAKVERLGQELGLADEAAPNTRRLSQLLIDRQSQLMAEQGLLRGLTNLTRAQLAEVLPTAIPDALLNSLIEQLTLAQQRLLSFNADHGPNHPECVKFRAQVSDLETKINDRGEGIMLGLQERVDSLQKGLGKLREELDQATANDVERQGKQAAYTDEKNRLEELERFRRVLSMKIASEKIGAQEPKTVPRIIETAVPMRSAPKTRPLVFPLIAFGLLLDAFGLGLMRFTGP